MASKINKLRKAGMPSDEFDPGVEADLEESMEDEEDLGVEEAPEEMGEEAPVEGGSVAEVLDMLAGLSPEELDEVAAEIEMLQSESMGEDEEFEGEDFEMEDDSEEMPEEEE